MATRSAIGRVNKDKSVTAIYCHNDGYPKGVGECLKDNYKTDEKVDQLIALGDISVLDAEIGEKHDFDMYPLPGPWCSAYGRDRGKEGTDAKEFYSEEDYVESFERWAMYHYLWKDGEWVMWEDGEWITGFTDDDQDEDNSK